MDIAHLWQQLLEGLLATTWLEYIAVFFGIASVVLSRMENIWVYPTGIVNTTIYIYLSVIAGLYAEAGVNFYYTVMSIIGWVLWARKSDGETVLHITRSSRREWLAALAFFAVAWGLLYWVLRTYTDSTVPLADGFASATAYTGMWLMARKKLENWYYWLAVDILASVIYVYKGIYFYALLYGVYVILAISGYVEWRKSMKEYHA